MDSPPTPEVVTADLLLLLRYLRWMGVGVTAALVGGAIATGLSAASKYDDLKNTCGNTPAGCTDSQTDTVKSRALVTNILWGLAGTAWNQILVSSDSTTWTSVTSPASTSWTSVAYGANRFVAVARDGTVMYSGAP